MDLIQNIPDWLILINKCKQQPQKQATVRQSGSVFVLACCLTIGPWCNEPLGQTLLLFPSLPAQARFENPRIFFLSVRLKIVLKHIPLICRQLWALSFFSFFFFFYETSCACFQIFLCCRSSPLVMRADGSRAQWQDVTTVSC